MPQVFLAVESAVSRSLPLSAQQTINVFTERQNPVAKSQAPIFGAPGLSEFSEATNGSPSRGAWTFNGVAYFVAGTALYQVNQDGSVTDVSGTESIPGSGPVDMSDNGVEMGIVNGQSGWMYSLSGGLQQITSSNFHAADTITFLDGYFIFDWKGTNQFFLSGLYDGMSYSGNDTASAEAQPGYVIGVTSYLQFLYVFCQNHIEIWYNAGTASFPLQRYSGGIVPFGAVGPHAIVAQDGALFFVGADRVIYRLQGNNVTRISTHEMEHILSGETNLQNIETVTYTLEGHKFINVYLPHVGNTIVYDVSTTKWHERSSNVNGVELGYWRGRVVLEVYDKILVGDAIDGHIGYVDWTTYTEYGEQITGLVHSAPIHDDRMKIFMAKWELDIQAGVGLQVGQGDDPQIMLRYSRDGGNTWSLQQKWRSMGKIGEYLKRLRWLRLGQARQWVFEIRITDPIPRVIIAAHADYVKGYT